MLRQNFVTYCIFSLEVFFIHSPVLWIVPNWIFFLSFRLSFLIYSIHSPILSFPLLSLFPFSSYTIYSFFRPVLCPFSTFGCMAELVSKNLPDHMDSCTNSHLLLVIAFTFTSSFLYFSILLLIYCFIVFLLHTSFLLIYFILLPFFVLVLVIITFF